MPLLKARLDSDSNGNSFVYRGVCVYCSRPIVFTQSGYRFCGSDENCCHVRGMKSRAYCRWFILRSTLPCGPESRPESLTLSSAILVGCRYGRQLFSQLMNEQGDSCATGAALFGIGYTFEEVTARMVQGLLPGTLVRRAFPFAAEDVACPECEEDFDLVRLMSHLQDKHRWTREAIASVVAQIEQANEVTA